MSQSLVELAQQELEDHGVEVDEPSRVNTKEDMDVMDVIEGGGLGEGISSASYNTLTDTVNLFVPLAKVGAVGNVLSDEQYNQILSQLDSEETPAELQNSVKDAFQNINAVSGLMDDMGGAGKVNETAEYVATGRAIYDALKNGMETESVDQDTIQEMREEAQHQLQVSTEHELIHKQGTDAFLEERGERVYSLLTNLKEVAGIEENALFEDDSHIIKRAREKFENKEGMFPLNQEDLMYAAVVDIDDGYEEKKREVEEKLELLDREEERAEELYDESIDTWRDILHDDKDDIFGDDRELRNAYIEMQHSTTNLLEEDDELTREDYRELLEERGIYTPERVDRLMDAEEAISDVEDQRSQERDLIRDRRRELYNELEEYIEDRADELEEQIKEYVEPVFERAEANSEIPIGSVGESFAHFWTMYRKDDLEDADRREQKKEGLRKNYPDGGDRAAEVIDDLFTQYDEMNGSPGERVSEIMQQQEQYLEEEMQPGFMDKVMDRMPDSDYLPF